MKSIEIKGLIRKTTGKTRINAARKYNRLGIYELIHLNIATRPKHNFAEREIYCHLTTLPKLV